MNKGFITGAYRDISMRSPALSPSQAAALASIECAGPLTPSELARIERAILPQASKLLERILEDGGE
jgi:DNA-binding MarR family transcriptional regulator